LQTLSTSGLDETNLCVCYWAQTFQSIFDGVNKS